MATSPNHDLLQRSSISKWLSGHHPDVALSYARPIRKQQIEDWMKSSFIPSETHEATLWNRDPDEIITESLVFTQESKPATTSDELRKTLHKPESFDLALEVAHKVGDKRIAHGINPATILAEHRRQIILKALLDTGRAKESREVCKDRLQAYIDRKGTFATKVVETSKISSKSRMRTLSPISPKSPTHRNKKGSPSRSQQRHGSPLSTSSVISTGSFQPEWGNYDVMRHRWAYLRPQTRELVGEDESIVPTTQSEVFVFNGELVCGPLRDVEHFASNTNMSTKSRSSSKRSFNRESNGGNSSGKS